LALLCKNKKVVCDQNLGLVTTVINTVGEETHKVMKIGDRVRIIESVIVYHHPEHRGQPLDIKDREGEIVSFANEWQGKAISANFPLVVKFDKKFRAHLRADEIEVLS
jgi:hypothetical protein